MHPVSTIFMYLSICKKVWDSKDSQVFFWFMASKIPGMHTLDALASHLRTAATNPKADFFYKEIYKVGSLSC